MSDDSHVYVSTPANDAVAAVGRLTACIADINDWMKASRLPLKTQIMWLGTSQQLDKITVRDVPLLSTGDSRRFSTQPRRHYRQPSVAGCTCCCSCLSCRSGYYQLRQLRPVTGSLSPDAAKTLVQTSSRLDYCNALLFGVSEGEIYKNAKTQIFLHYDSAKKLLRKRNINRYREPQQWFTKAQTGLSLCISQRQQSVHHLGLLPASVKPGHV